jgi:TetR/AcrR family transcriptional regulator, lmrAB and yxaGH operons repressor
MSCPSSMPTRQRLVTAAAELFRRRGYAGTGIKAILDAAGAPYGSLYHHFPGGKAELGRVVVEEGGAAYLALVEAFFRPDVDPVDATREFFAGGVELLESTGFVDACPIASIAAEIADTDEPMRAAAAAAFESWIDALAAHLVSHGVEPARARAAGVELFCLVEGCLLLARTTRSAAPVRTAGELAVAVVAAALAPAAADAR